MAVSKLIRYLKEKDKNGVTISFWAIETGTAGWAKCKYCECPVTFKSGKAALIAHSESGKHVRNKGNGELSIFQSGH